MIRIFRITTQKKKHFLSSAVENNLRSTETILSSSGYTDKIASFLDANAAKLLCSAQSNFIEAAAAAA